MGKKGGAARGEDCGGGCMGIGAGRVDCLVPGVAMEEEEDWLVMAARPSGGDLLHSSLMD